MFAVVCFCPAEVSAVLRVRTWLYTSTGAAAWTHACGMHVHVFKSELDLHTYALGKGLLKASEVLLWAHIADNVW